MWCPAPLPEGEQHRRKLRSDKYKPPAGRLLEFYESDSSVEADEDTGDEAGGGDAGAAPDAGGAAKAWRRTTRSAVAKKFAPAVAAAVSEDQANLTVASPPAVVSGFPSGSGHYVDSDTSLAGGRIISGGGRVGEGKR
jgi:hypothetical protein